MNDSAVSADDTAVLFIDLQVGIVNIGVTNDPARLTMAVAALADLAGACSLPVYVCCVPATSGAVAPLMEPLRVRLHDAKPHVRSTPNPMDDARFCAMLAASGRKTLIIAGVVTEVAVRLFALAALRDGYRPIIAVDACGGLHERTEAAAFTHLSTAGVGLSAVPTVAAELAGDFDSERGRAAMRALQSTIRSHPAIRDDSSHGAS